MIAKGRGSEVVDLKKFSELKALADRYRKERDKAEGALSQLMATLEKEYGCSTLEEAEKKVAELEAELQRLTEQFESELEAFEREWGDRLREYGKGI